jgi:hypothetical protein
VRLLRGLAAIVVFLLATVLLIVAIVCCVTIILLPLGIPLAFVALRLYAKGVRLLVPRSKEVERGVRKVWRQKTKAPAKRVKKIRKRAGQRVRRVRSAVHV